MCLVDKDLRPIKHVSYNVASSVVPLFGLEAVCRSVVFDGGEVGVPVVRGVPVFAFKSSVDSNHALIEIVNIASSVRIAIGWLGVVIWLEGPYPSKSLNSGVPHNKRCIAFDAEENR